MKKAILFALLFLLVLPSIFALNFEVQKESSDEVMIEGLDNPIKINITVTNMGEQKKVQFYNLLGFEMNPREKILFEAGETKEIPLTIFPREGLDVEGYYTFKYFIQAEDRSKNEERLVFRMIGLEDAFEIYSEEVTPPVDQLTISIKNKENVNFKDLDVKFKSPFFEEERTISLEPYETKNISIKIEEDSFKGFMAGFYTLNTEIDLDGEYGEVEGKIEFSEEDILDKSEREYGFLIRTKEVEKENVGNVVISSSTKIEKNVLSRLFTIFSPSPDFVERDGFSVEYTWENNIPPGETLKISTKTNWLLPSFIALFLVAVIFIIRKYSIKELVLRKRVSFVNIKGGEFALKVSITLSAREDIENVTIVDKIPHLVKLFERFGQEKPTKIDEKNKRVEWSFNRLEKGEKRILSYIIYSKVGVLGKFALPTTSAFYEKNGSLKETESNRAFFVAEQRNEKEKK